MTDEELVLIEREIESESQGRYSLGKDSAGADIRVVPNPLAATAARLLVHVRHLVQENARLNEEHEAWRIEHARGQNFRESLIRRAEVAEQEIETLTRSRDGWKADAEREAQNNVDKAQEIVARQRDLKLADACVRERDEEIARLREAKPK